MNCRSNAAFLRKNPPSIPSRIMRIGIRMLNTLTTLSRSGLCPIIIQAIQTYLCKCQVWRIGPERKWGLQYTEESCRDPELKQRRHLSLWSITSHKVREIRCHWAHDHRLISHRLRVLQRNLWQTIPQRLPLIHCLRWDMLKPTTPLVASLMLSKMLLSRIYRKLCKLSNSKSPQFTLSETLCLTIPNAQIVCPNCSNLNSPLTALVPIRFTTIVALR